MNNIQMQIAPIVQSLREIGSEFIYIPNTIKHLNRLNNKYRNKDKINVMFITQFPEMWNSVKSLYNLLITDNRFNVSVLTIPKRDSSNESGKRFQKDDAFEFFLKEGVEAKHADIRRISSLKKYDPDFIFIQRPYDDMMPKDYSIRNICKIGLVCYIPYSARLTKGIHLSYELNPHLLRYFFAFFADCEDSFMYTHYWIETRRYRKLKHAFNIGFPRYDLIKQVEVDDKRKKSRFTWLPRWSLNEENDRSTFLEYIDTVLDFFEQRKDLHLVIRPHPLMFSNFLKNGAITEEGIKNIHDRVDMLENVTFDINKDYLQTFDETDVLIADVTSLLFEFFFSGKPIICLSKFSNLTEDGKKMADTFLYAYDKEELLWSIDKVIECDPMRNERKAALNGFETFKHVSADNIRNTLIAISRGNYNE